MSSITFSEFANMIYPYCGYGENRSEFVKTLTNQIMGGRPGRAKGDGYVNPMLNKDAGTLQNYFNGSRPIPQSDASVILGSIDKYKFEKYVESFSEDTLLLLENDLFILSNNKEIDNSLDTAAKCADMFVEILQELASIKKKTE